MAVRLTNTQLLAEIQALRTALAARDQQVDDLQVQLAARDQQLVDVQAQLLAAQARIASLEQRPPDPPAFVKPHTPPRAPRPRRKRDPRHNHGRRYDVPTDVVAHAFDHCPDCQRQLTGQRIARRRQVIDLPPPVPVTVTDHQIITR